jgi:hypothetical protein
MVSQVANSLLAIATMVTSPLLHYWEHGAEVAAHADGGCGDRSHAAPSQPPVDSKCPGDDHRKCDCKYRVAVPQTQPCDIAELAARHFIGDHVATALDALRGGSDHLSAPSYATPVHFLPAADGGDLCARISRHRL